MTDPPSKGAAIELAAEVLDGEVVTDDAALFQEVERDPKAFFDKTANLTGLVDAREWAQAKWLHDQWNPHDLTDEELPGAPKTPPDGTTQKALGIKVGWSQSEVSKWIAVHRRFGISSTRECSFKQAYMLVKGETASEHYARGLRTGGRRALREFAGDIAPEIAGALDQPRVAAAVAWAMTEEQRQALATLILDPPELPEEPEQSPEPEAVDAAVAKRQNRFSKFAKWRAKFHDHLKEAGKQLRLAEAMAEKRNKQALGSPESIDYAVLLDAIKERVEHLLELTYVNNVPVPMLPRQRPGTQPEEAGDEH